MSCAWTLPVAHMTAILLDKDEARVYLHSNAAKQFPACELQQAANNEGAALLQSASAYLRRLALVQQA